MLKDIGRATQALVSVAPPALLGAALALRGARVFPVCPCRGLRERAARFRAHPRSETGPNGPSARLSERKQVVAPTATAIGLTEQKPISGSGYEHPLHFQ